METNLVGRKAKANPELSSSEPRVGEIVAVDMKQGANCFLVLTLLFTDKTLKTLPERDVVIEDTP